QFTAQIAAPILVDHCAVRLWQLVRGQPPVHGIAFKLQHVSGGNRKVSVAKPAEVLDDPAGGWCTANIELSFCQRDVSGSGDPGKRREQQYRQERCQRLIKNRPSHFILLTNSARQCGEESAIGNRERRGRFATRNGKKSFRAAPCGRDWNTCAVIPRIPGL